MDLYSKQNRRMTSAAEMLANKTNRKSLEATVTEEGSDLDDDPADGIGG